LVVLLLNSAIVLIRCDCWPYYGFGKEADSGYKEYAAYSATKYNQSTNNS